MKRQSEVEQERERDKERERLTDREIKRRARAAQRLKEAPKG